MKKLLTLAMVMSLSAASSFAFTEQDVTNLLGQLKNQAQSANLDSGTVQDFISTMDFSKLANLATPEFQDKINAVLAKVNQIAQNVAQGAGIDASVVTSAVTKVTTAINDQLSGLQINQSEVDQAKTIQAKVTAALKNPQLQQKLQDAKSLWAPALERAKEAYNKINLDQVKALLAGIVAYVKTGQLPDDLDLANIIGGAAQIKNAILANAAIANAGATIYEDINSKVLDNTQFALSDAEKALLNKVQSSTGTIGDTLSRWKDQAAHALGL